MIPSMVSILVACYNSEKYIDDCIESLINQTYKNIEIIICDDASTDGTWDHLVKLKTRDDRIKVFKNDKNMHQAFSRNRCLFESRGEYIAIQDADDYSESTRIEREIQEFNSSEIDFVSCGFFKFDDHGIYEKCSAKKYNPTKKDFYFRLPFCHASTVFKRECIVDVGGYTVSKITNRSEDYDLFMKLYAKGYSGINILDQLYGYRVDKNTYSRRTLSSYVDECKIRFNGFKAMGILFPKGLLYCIKPIAAYILNLLRKAKR